MGRIKDRNKYPEDPQVSLDDSLIGSGVDENGKTFNYPIRKIVELIQRADSKAVEGTDGEIDVDSGETTYTISIAESFKEGYIKKEGDAGISGRLVANKYITGKEDNDFAQVKDIVKSIEGKFIKKEGDTGIEGRLVANKYLEGKEDNDFAQIKDLSEEITTATKFTEDFPYNFGAGRGLGILVGTGTYPTTGLTYEEFLREISNEYIAPVFTSFNIQSEPQTVEVGTTISGSKTFKWGITLNNGVVPTINIYDNTAGVVLANTTNNGTKVQTITTIKLDAKDATQSWKGIAVNTAGANVNSANFVVTAQFNLFYKAVDSLPVSPSDGSANRTYANTLFKKVKTNGANSFTLDTGVTSNKFIVLLPPSVTITSVIDTGNLNLNITSSYILSTITIKDAGGTDRIYNQYLFNPAGAYPVSTNHVITTN